MLNLFFFAKLITSRVSVIVPIWFGLIKIALAANSLTPFFNRTKFVNDLFYGVKLDTKIVKIKSEKEIIEYLLQVL